MAGRRCGRWVAVSLCAHRQCRPRVGGKERVSRRSAGTGLCGRAAVRRHERAAGEEAWRGRQAAGRRQGPHEPVGRGNGRAERAGRKRNLRCGVQRGRCVQGVRAAGGGKFAGDGMKKWTGRAINRDREGLYLCAGQRRTGERRSGGRQVSDRPFNGYKTKKS